MFSPHPIRAILPRDDAALDAFLENLPPSAAVFVLALDEGQQPYLGRCGNLRRRAKRILRVPTGPTRLLHLRGIAREISYWPAASSLESNLVLLDQARALFPHRYRRLLRLRFPSYLRLLAGNRFPRVQITQQPDDAAYTFGPFLYRSQAEDFASRALDHFLLRRCDEELFPALEHPGCIYGEMKLCLRPCQAAIPDHRYSAEADAFLAFLATGGESLKAPLETQRNEASEALDFEAAARAHKRLQKLEECWRGIGAICDVLSQLHGVAVTAANAAGEVRLWPVFSAKLHAARTLNLEALNSKAIADSLSAMPTTPIAYSQETERELLAVLTKWAASSWCDGEWVKIGDPGKLPTRKIANAARRVHARRWEEGAAPVELPVAAPESEALDET